VGLINYGFSAYAITLQTGGAICSSSDWRKIDVARCRVQPPSARFAGENNRRILGIIRLHTLQRASRQRPPGVPRKLLDLRGWILTCASKWS
jgi:hypothetical protein